MRWITAGGAEHKFGRLIDLERTAPVAVAKHGRPVVVIVIEDSGRVKWLPAAKAAASRGSRTAAKFAHGAGE